MPKVEWTWHFEDLPPAAVWPVLADTNRFNEILGLPSYQLEEVAQPDGTVLRRGTGRVAGIDLAWDEKPCEWVLHRRFRQTRVFSKGPFRVFGPTLDVTPTGGGSTVIYALRWEPMNWLGRLTGLRLARSSGRLIERRVKEGVAFLRGGPPMMFDYTPPAPAAGVRERLDAMVRDAEATGYAHGQARRLADRLLSAMEVDLQRVRPKALAAAFDIAPRDAIELCLAGVKARMLDMRWDLLCSNCRGAKMTVSSLDQLPRGAHCASCNIDYDRDFARNVELTFAPSPLIRALGTGMFCLSGPATTPHVVTQQLLAAGERRIVAMDLPPGPYRLRTLHPGRAVDIDHAGGPFPGLRITANGVDVLAAEKSGEIVFVNEAGFELAALVETRDWVREALTAHEVTTLQAFRELFADATLRPGDEAGIGQVTILFTDLRSSTALYEQIGDAAAFNLVRAHFAVLGKAVRDANGAVVKTIGDAVMAAFADPADAVRAALAIRSDVAALDRRLSAERGLADGALVVKIGLHMGPSIAVNLNDRLDYFGTTVNMAARLQGQSLGGDIVLSRAVADDPAVRPVLADAVVHDETVTLKGFGAPVPFVRIVA
ncbi:adenylate/guanylate cyclase domain-containing protein [Reyranella sp. CPCC 100927]|uniref:adenylate/guanylate cyclase domain-containing protein n=1 Tax=Reyranella sp. CPCC 100927 TaxID=2599616 RepID=UPI0011B7905A|nr:adenylate/guanylate cyclase domain-containing protein [Reyranella sp. CPCC 100927]TWT02910.1 adenylate/guanylate cyclase domain-containing protein [Reyranella sp. CPCC 100927]